MATVAEGRRPLREGDRIIQIDSHSVTCPVANETYLGNDNEVITSSYTWWNFIPVNLFEQFHNLANLYFLAIGILQIIPAISTTGGIPTMYQPLAFIVFVSALRAATEDWQKHRADEHRNGYQYLVWTANGFQPTRAGSIRIGNIVKVRKDEMVPADMIFLASSNSKGHCFIDKANLNGETTLEVLNSINQTRALLGSDADVGRLRAELEYEPPNKRFDSLRGILRLIVDGKPGEDIPCTGKVLVMRETNLKNTDYIYGLVIYTGNDTKIQRSNLEGEKPKVKESQIMRSVQQFLKIMLCAQLTLCAIGAVLCSVWNHSDKGDSWYLWPDSDYGQDRAHYTAFLAFFSWFILLAQMVPISLIVSAELVKFVQSRFIQWDLNLYYPPIDKTARCNVSTIHEDLGLIDYIFSDKTGTLTQNKMEFRYALLPIGDYGSKETEIARSVKTRMAELQRKQSDVEAKAAAPSTPWTVLEAPLRPPPRDDEPEDCCHKSCFSSCWNQPKRTESKDESEAAASMNCFTEQEKKDLLKDLWGRRDSGESEEEYENRRRLLRIYMTHMALSNTVKPYDDNGVLKFQAEAAEESAMVAFARDIGFTKRMQNPTVLEVTEYDADLQSSRTVAEKYNHIATLGFTSARARVTVIYQRQSDNRIIVMTKGQDTVVLPLLETCPNKEELLLSLNDLCTNGLRTLVAGHAEHDQEWWESRAAAYHEVVARDESEQSKGHSDGKCKKEPLCEKCSMHNVFLRLEQDAKLEYIGCIGLEDQLQLLVPDCIKDCLRAGIRVWMITGDKLETAKNIGLACNLIDADMPPQFRKDDSLDDAIAAFNSSRLIEVTGQWASLADKESELMSLFRTFDQDRDGLISREELVICLRALKFNLHESQLATLMGDAGDGMITPEEFVKLMRSHKLSMYEAVKFDIDQGWQRYSSITDKATYPISILVNRTAFEVMYPGKLPAGQTAPPDAPTEEQLEALRKRFFDLAAVSKSVVFARAQPAMKKKMVTEIQARVPGAVTLAIGDGANDTDMITAAHIGVGIAGVEGTAATNSADYAIGTFRMLHTLLFVHGFWSYHRVAQLVNFIFYKACLLAVTGYFFGFFSGFSGQQFYNDPILQLYNIVYTALPVMAVAILNKHLPRDALQNNPLCFKEAKGKAFNQWVFWGWIARSVFHSAVIFFFPYAVFAHQDVAQNDGATHGLWFFSTIVYHGVALVPTFLVLLEMVSMTLLHVLTIVASVAAIFLFTFILSIWTTHNPDLEGEVTRIYANGNFWLILLITVALPFLLEMAIRAFWAEVRPTWTQIMQEKIRTRRKERDSMMKATPHSIELNVRVPECITTSEEEERKWLERKTQRRVTLKQYTSRTPVVRVEEKEHQADALRLAVIQSMLRFKNLTGATFDSAAQAQYQVHDRLGSKTPDSPRGEFKESKVPAGSVILSTAHGEISVGDSVSTLGPTVVLHSTSTGERLSGVQFHVAP